MGRGRTDCQQDAVRAAIADAGLVATPLREWVVDWPSSKELRDDLAASTLYVTLEPTAEKRGEVCPAITQLIKMSRIPRVVIGCPDPIPERSMDGAAMLHEAGIIVSVGVEQEECENLISQYAQLVTSKLQRFARKHFKDFESVSCLLAATLLLCQHVLYPIVHNAFLNLFCFYSPTIPSHWDFCTARLWIVMILTRMHGTAMLLEKTLVAILYHLFVILEHTTLHHHPNPFGPWTLTKMI